MSCLGIMGFTNQTCYLYYQNTRGLNTKLTGLYAAALAMDYDIIILTETWLKNGVYDGEIFDSRYNVFRQDRAVKRGGGVLIAVTNHIVAIKVDFVVEGIEIICVKVNLGHSTYYVLTVYFPPNSKIGTYNDFFSEIEKHKTLHYNNVIIIGDFNLSSVSELRYDILQGGGHAT